MTDGTSDDEQLRFIVKGAFNLRSRGTSVIGHIEAGRVVVGDRLRVVRVDGELGPAAECTGAGRVRVASWEPGQPVPVALLLPGLQVSDIREGDVLVRDAVIV
ncbi:hypothetical protein OHB26_37910 [Nocardia sp. NBC_01503]|uniref:hypothetical protein n=1 Tax=Nocardia sp. NBC_01503 TaxID=2975997 RepID=UPI002E7AD439|nr:hypothetical protein [Nocardia sp. NBC_01503]WTL32560.1 hypothetical protein OHB26_37910 [Nocardia sp. NBC_01503]